MKLYIRISILFLLFVNLSNSQNSNVSGKAIYKQKYLKNVENTNNSTFNSYESILQKNIDKLSFSLVFNRNEYSFEHIDKLEVDDERGYKLALTLGNGKGKYYGNISEDIRLHKKEAFGKEFIIKTSSNIHKWEIQNETRTIGKYECRKAILTETINTSRGKVKRLITAWYASELPLPFGPIGYGNLPGLILELKIGEKYLFQCEKITFSDSKLEITRPSKGKLITESEFNIVSEKAYKSVRKRG